MKNGIFIIIPAYNEEKRIGKVLRGLKKYNLPTIVVDDGSRDRTSKIAKKGATITLRRRVNLGSSKGAALKTGIEYAFELGAKAVILMDSDGQHKASDLPKFIKALDEGYELVVGTRNFSMGVPLIRFLGNKIASVIVNLLGVYFSDIPCGYRALTKKAYKELKWESLGYGVETEMLVRLSKTNLKYCEVPVEIVYYDKVKGVTVVDAIGIMFDVIRWKLNL